ncbi:MAG: response regulator transcription factor [Gammaproteobacteria bacterium]|nr:response regulator transcription factor [Gammaproteobacteria bacterium]
MNVYLVEDDIQLSELMSLWLEAENIESDCFTTGKSILDALNTSKCDLIVLDWNLPDMQGDDLLISIRDKIGWDTPIIFVTGRTEKDDIVSALEKGANDYMTKPVDRKEWVARVRLQLRQKIQQGEFERKVIKLENIEINTDTHTITVSNRNIDITPKEFEVAFQLFKNIGKVVSRKDLMKNIWGYSSEINTRTVDTHISRVKRKLELTPDKKWNLSSIYNYGYRLEIAK